jgi:site-specific DNA-methyltransferase (adenine-specific)
MAWENAGWEPRDKIVHIFGSGFPKSLNVGKAIGKTGDSAEAKQWEGWGTALKPASEDWWLFRKPLGGTVAANVLACGTGAINIDGCRIGTEERTYDLTMVSGGFETTGGGRNVKSGEKTVVGRWPANVILSKPEDEYALKDDITDDQRKELFKWFYENA